jgi:hypothetical protein
VDGHSHETVWPWYASVAPGKFLLTQAQREVLIRWAQAEAARVQAEQEAEATVEAAAREAAAEGSAAPPPSGR